MPGVAWSFIWQWRFARLNVACGIQFVVQPQFGGEVEDPAKGVLAVEGRLVRIVRPHLGYQGFHRINVDIAQTALANHGQNESLDDVPVVLLSRWLLLFDHLWVELR